MQQSKQEWEECGEEWVSLGQLDEDGEWRTLQLGNTTVWDDGTE